MLGLPWPKLCRSRPRHPSANRGKSLPTSARKPRHRRSLFRMRSLRAKTRSHPPTRESIRRSARIFVSLCPGVVRTRPIRSPRQSLLISFVLLLVQIHNIKSRINQNNCFKCLRIIVISNLFYLVLSRTDLSHTQISARHLESYMFSLLLSRGNFLVSRGKLSCTIY